MKALEKEVLKTEKRLPVLEIARINLKHHARLSVMVCAAILFVTPLIFGTSNLERQASAVPLEMFVSLMGIVLLTPVFQPEQIEEIGDLTAAKYVSQISVWLIRAVCAVLISLIGLGGIAFYMRLQACEVTLLLIAGTMANVIFLGSLGMMTAAVSDQTIIAYMIPMVYYTLNYGMGSKLGNFYLFSMCADDFAPKKWLFATGILFVLASLAVKQVKLRFR